MREELREALARWLAAMALFYPLYFSSQFLLHAAPALARVVFLGERLEALRVGWLAVSAFSSLGRTEVAARPADPWLPALAVSAGVALIGRRRRWLAGLAIAVLSHAALVPWARRILIGREASAKTVLAFVVLLGLVGFGLWWTSAGARWWLRMSGLLLSVPLPWLALWTWGTRFPRESAIVLVPGLAAAVLASLGPPRPPVRTTLRPVLAGLVLTAILASAVPGLGRAADRWLEASRRAALERAAPIPPGLPYPKIFFQKGVNFTAEWPHVYRSQGARETLEMLPKYGIDAVALVPYGFAALDRPRISRGSGPGFLESDEGIEFLSRAAHRLGIRVMLKPQLWVGRRSYPGELNFRSPADREAWFAQYWSFLEHYARLAARIHADVFCLGVELSRLTGEEERWREMIRRTRELYPGPLTYAAGWGPEFETIAFWDALDYIGLNNYYPLPDDLSMDAVAAKVEAVSGRFGRPVLFTEAGFSSYANPHREPWAERPGRLEPGGQARCYEALFRAFYHRPWFMGVYWWKVGTNRWGGPEDGSHTPWGKPAMRVIAAWYLGSGR